ncbi:hypothetical protein OF83DRAFT_469476 [Amylostereum chailletii]|nr:hypothetical protein OF83DRAFT_469476 [Amylostereum chailletii]
MILPGIAQKAKLRAKHRHLLPVLVDEKYDFVSEAVYQSTDEMGDKDTHHAQPSAVASDTMQEDIEGVLQDGVGVRPPRKKPTSAPCITRAPTYRSAEVTRYLDELDKKIRALGMHVPSRTRGDPKDVPLPAPKKRRDGCRPPRIHRTLIDPEWLESNKNQDMVSRICGDGEEGENGYEAGAEKGNEEEIGPEEEGEGTV